QTLGVLCNALPPCRGPEAPGKASPTPGRNRRSTGASGEGQRVGSRARQDIGHPRGHAVPGNGCRAGAASASAAFGRRGGRRAPATAGDPITTTRKPPPARPRDNGEHQQMSTVRLEAVKNPAARKERDIPMQPASSDIWDKKYRLKTKSGQAIDADIDGTYQRVAKALADA